MADLNFYYYMRENDEVIECNFYEWNQLVKNYGKNQVVRYETIELDCGTEVEVSTICLRLDHNLFTKKNMESPLIFETMLFSDNPYYDGKQRRASTLEQAKKNHSKFIDEIKGKENV